MKLLLTLLMLSIYNYTSAQYTSEKIIGYYKNEYFVLHENNFFLVERLSPLKYNCVKYDTLFPVNNVTDSFVGETYFLLFKNKKFYLTNKNYKKEVMTLRIIDNDAIQIRNRKHNFFYYRPYESKISKYSRLLREQNSNRYENFIADREMLYKKANELNINDFKNYFDAFLKKYGL